MAHLEAMAHLDPMAHLEAMAHAETIGHAELMAPCDQPRRTAATGFLARGASPG
jgi:hypothetical protein